VSFNERRNRRTVVTEIPFFFFFFFGGEQVDKRPLKTNNNRVTIDVRRRPRICIRAAYFVHNGEFKPIRLYNLSPVVNSPGPKTLGHFAAVSGALLVFSRPVPELPIQPVIRSSSSPAFHDPYYGPVR